MVIWLIGMSASGKTTVAREMIKILRRQYVGESWILLDGDAFRNITQEDVGHTVEGRKKNADRLCAFCAFLSSQGINVLACVLSIFHESQDWLRENIEDYRQVYIKVDYEILKKRDNKDLYLKAEKGEMDNVVGVQIPFPNPKNTDFVLENNSDNASPFELACKTINGLKIGTKRNSYKYTEVDRIANPFKYQYQPFEGRGFLDSYRQNREEAIRLLKEKAEEAGKYFKGIINGENGRHEDIVKFILSPFYDKVALENGWVLKAVSLELMPGDYKERFLEGVDSGNILITREFLVKELNDLAHKQWDYSSRKTNILTLVKRFEISKKVFNFYRLPQIKKVKRDFSDLHNFILFHMLLVRVHEKADKYSAMIIENSFLKLGDILVSIIHRMISPAQINIACASICKELEIMEKKYGI
ncbi:MAG: adenylyl-sulfate kinase [bacterium]